MFLFEKIGSMLNGSSEWSPLSAARTVSDGNLANDENHEDEVSTLATTKARQIKREIIRRNVDEEENAQAGIRSIYKFGKTLGKGSFAIVKEAEHKETGALVAVKIIDKIFLVKFIRPKFYTFSIPNFLEWKWQKFSPFLWSYK